MVSKHASMKKTEPLHLSITDEERELLEGDLYKSLRWYPFDASKFRTGTISHIKGDEKVSKWQYQMQYALFCGDYMAELCLYTYDKCKLLYGECIEKWIQYGVLKEYDYNGVKHVQIEFIDKWIKSKLNKSVKAKKSVKQRWNQKRLPKADLPTQTAAEILANAPRLYSYQEISEGLINRYKKENKPTSEYAEFTQRVKKRYKFVELESKINDFANYYAENGVNPREFNNLEQVEASFIIWCKRDFNKNK